MDLQKVLIIEDSEKVSNQVYDGFEAAGITVIRIKDSDQLEKYLPTLKEYQMIILDWLLDGSTSDSAKVCLTKIRNTFFIPVVVWTEERETFEGEEDDVYKLFPEAYIKCFGKNEVDHEKLLEILQDWYSRPPMNFTNQFRASVVKAVESTLYNLANHSSDDLVRGLKHVFMTGSDKMEVNIEHPISVLVRLLSRDLLHDDDYVNNLREIIEQLNLKEPPKTKKEINIEKRTVSLMQDLFMFYEPRNDDAIVCTGDIVKLNFLDNEPVKLDAIVISPTCDLANPEKTIFLRLAVIHECEPEDRRDSIWRYKDDGIDFMVCYQEIVTLKNVTLDKLGEKPDQIMNYNQTFTTLNGGAVTITRHKRLDDPYRADLLHHFVSHAGRIGVPAFKAPIV